MTHRSFIRHIVFFSASKKSDITRVMEGLSLLKDIPHSTVFEVSRNSGVDELSREVDVVVYAEFESHEALEAYKAHPIYQRSIEVVRPLREMRIAADV